MGRRGGLTGGRIPRGYQAIVEGGPQFEQRPVQLEPFHFGRTVEQLLLQPFGARRRSCMAVPRAGVGATQ